MGKLTVNYRVQDDHGVHDKPYAIVETIDYSELDVDQPYVDWTTFPAIFALKFAAGPAHLVGYGCDDDAGTPITSELIASDLIGLGIPPGIADPMGWLQTNFNVNGKLIFPAKIKPGAKSLILSYDNEGGARLFVSARSMVDGTLIAPVGKQEITGKDASFPLKAAVIGEGSDQEYEVPPTHFGWWADTDATTAQAAPLPGCWETEDLPDGTFDLYAKRSIGMFAFDHFEYQTLNWIFAPPLITDGIDTKEDASPDPVLRLGSSQVNSYLIVWYKPGKPEKDDGDPVKGKIPWWQWGMDALGAGPRIVHLIEGFFYDLADLRGGRIVRRRHAPGTSGHEEELPSGPISPDQRDRLVAAARLYPDNQDALERALDELHR